MKASQLVQFVDYPNFTEFKKNNIDLSLTHANVLLTLQRIRGIAGFPIYPGHRRTVFRSGGAIRQWPQ